MTTRIKGCVHAAAIALLLPAVASAETVPLFDETLVTSSGFNTDISRTEVFKTSDPVTVYCVGDQTAYVKDDNGDPPIVDNYMTAGNDLQSICLGGSPINSGGPTSGTHCFNSGNGSLTGGDIRDTFNADSVTAPVSLTDGENNLTFKLWDYGVVYGNTPLELVLPEGCSTTPQCWENETAWSAGERYTTRGNWATFTNAIETPTNVTLYAAQNLEAGTVNFEILRTSPDTTKITITLNDGFRFAVDEDENLKIQGYGSKPSGNPRPGQFAYKSTESGKSATVTVDYYEFYGVHVDVEVRVDCPPPVECTSDNGTLFDTVTVHPDGRDYSSKMLADGGKYLVVASGTYRFAPWGEEYGIADAAWNSRIAAFAPGGEAGWYQQVSTWLQLWIDGAAVTWEPAEFNPAHVYSYELDGTGSVLNFSIKDDKYLDNSGSLTAEIFECH